MNSQPAKTSPLWLCVWAALISLLVSAIVPVLCFQFPGPKFMPLPYELMWAVTELLWKPLRILQINLSPLFAYDLRQHVNPYYVAPLVNASLAFVAALGFLMLKSKWQSRSRDVGAKPDLRSVADLVREVRTDYPAALQQLPHPATHGEPVMQDARTKVAGHPFFQHRAEPEVSRQDDQPE